MSVPAVTTVYTVGHSNQTLEWLITLLTQAGIETLVDVRAQPRSTRHPHFNEEPLRQACGMTGIVYHWAGRHLGGMRKTRSLSPHCAMDEERRGFADHMDSDTFKKAITQLMSLAARTPTVILCAERDPDHCHRALIADYLLLQGFRVVHLLGPDESREHLLSPQARRESGELIYDRLVSGELNLT